MCKFINNFLQNAQMCKQIHIRFMCKQMCKQFISKALYIVHFINKSLQNN